MKYIIYPNPQLQPILEFRRIERDPVSKTDSEVKEHVTRVPGTKKNFVVGISRSKKRLNTGLDFPLENPFKGQTLSPDWKYLENKETISKQEELEFRHGQKPGFYSPGGNFAPGSVISDKKTPELIPFFQREESRLVLDDGANVFDTTNPRDEVFYYAFKAASKVAPGLSSCNGSHDWYMVEGDTDVTEKVSKRQEKNKAIARLTELNELGNDLIVDTYKVLNLGTASKHTLKSASRANAYAFIDDYISNTNTPQEHIREFNLVCNLREKDIDSFSARVLLFEALATGVIVKRGVGYVWIPPKVEGAPKDGEQKWTRMEEIIEFLKSPKYQTEQDIIREDIAYRSK